VSESKDAQSTIAFKREDPSGYRTARIVVTLPGGAIRALVLSALHVRIGSAPANDVILDDPHASRFHCEIRRTGEGYLLRDLGSTNGTRVGDVVLKEGLLQSGATIAIGATRIQFLADEGRLEEVVTARDSRSARWSAARCGCARSLACSSASRRPT
jgi:predicted component of type VI protein secretion system